MNKTKVKKALVKEALRKIRVRKNKCQSFPITDEVDTELNPSALNDNEIVPPTLKPPRD
jgi:hypothetical protein